MRDGVCTREARGRFDVVPDVRESALSSQHTARDRAMTRMIARALGRAEQSRAEQSKRARVRDGEDRVRFHLACMHTHVRGRGEKERDRDGERNDHQRSRGM